VQMDFICMSTSLEQRKSIFMIQIWQICASEKSKLNMTKKMEYAHRLLQKGFATNSLENINNLIHPTLEIAVDDDYIRKNPSKGIYRSLKREGTAPEAAPQIALSKKQLKNFLNFTAKHSTYNHWLPILVTLTGTGMRVAECTGLTWDDVDMENKTISVNHNLIYRVIDGKSGFHITTPKTAKGNRTIPMFPEVEEQLGSLYKMKDALYSDTPLKSCSKRLFRTSKFRKPA